MSILAKCQIQNGQLNIKIMESRSEHLQWCKDRALEILDETEDVGQAYASFGSDMNKHPETQDHSAIQLGVMLLMGGHNRGTEEMRKFIEGFN